MRATPRMADPAAVAERVMTTIDLYDFGVGIDVEAPPAGQVMSEEDLDAMLDDDG
jgi:hypothetical protein